MSINKYGGINDTQTGWSLNPENRKIYKLWYGMLRRCYDKEQLSRNRNRKYADCSVCTAWMNLSTFARDIKKLDGFQSWLSSEGMELDKDIRSAGIKMYSPITCCFVTRAENTKEMLDRNPNITQAATATLPTTYILTKDGHSVEFRSEKQACEYLGVSQCTVASCRRRKCLCKGYSITRIENAARDKGAHGKERER